MNERPTLETVKAAIKTALSDGSNPNRKTASDWLDSLKSSPFAWEICDQLLLERESVEICYLAAHMLRHKIYKNFNELPLECYTSLKDSILNHLKSNEDYAVQGQLTMAISDLTLLLKVWQNPIEELAQNLGLHQSIANLNPSNHYEIYQALHHRIIFADILHQMCDLNHSNNTQRPSFVGAKRREEYEDYLISKCGQAITWWLSTMKEIEDLHKGLQAHMANPQTMTESNINGLKKCSQAMEKLIGQIYLCFSAWLRVFDEQNMNDSLPILDSAFKHLKDENCSDKIHNYAVEVVISTTNYAEDSALEYMISHLLSQIYLLEPAFLLSVSNEDAGKSCNFARIFSAVAEVACQKYVIEEKDFRLVELLLNCMNHYDFDIVLETFHFWWMFLDLLQIKLKPEDYVYYLPYVNRFVMSLVKLCQFDPDEDSVVSTDQDIHSFRIDSSEIIYSILFVTEVRKFLQDNQQIVDTFRIPITNISWEKLESLLFLISCLNQMMTDADNQLRLQLFQMIISQQVDPSNPQTSLQTWPSVNVNLNIGIETGQIHPQIVATTLQVIATFDGFYAENQECLNIATNYIMASLNNPIYRNDMMRYAAEALAKVLQYSGGHNFRNNTNLVDIMRQLCEHLDEYEVASRDLLKAVAFLTAAISDDDIRDQFLCEIVNHNINSIKITLGMIQSPLPADKQLTDPIKYLDRLSELFRQSNDCRELLSLDKTKKFVNLLENELWPLILLVLEKKASPNCKTIERSCRTIRYMIRVIRPVRLLERIADTMIKLYETYPQNSSPLYIASILVDEFANSSPEINAGLFRMLDIFCQLTFTLLNLNVSQQQSLLTMKSYPETIDDMMRLFNRFMKKCTNEFLACPALPNIIELSISSLRIDHSDANSNVCKFVKSFIETSKDNAHIKDAIQNLFGARITDTVIRACLLDIPGHLIPDEAQILITLKSFDETSFRVWVEASVKSLPRTNIQGIETLTEEQLVEFKDAIITTNPDKFLVNCLRSFARQYA